MSGFRVIGNDERPILGIYGPEERWQITIGSHVGKIKGYIEDGDMPWFAIYDIDSHKIIQRVNAAFVESVVYK